MAISQHAINGSALSSPQATVATTMPLLQILADARGENLQISIDAGVICVVPNATYLPQYRHSVETEAWAELQALGVNSITTIAPTSAQIIAPSQVGLLSPR